MKALTILVAEDDLLSRMVLERSVVQWGHQLVSVIDGESAREVLQTRSIDVCLLDCGMPKMTGIEICQWLRATAMSQMPYVILITSKDQPAEIQAGYESGANDYITKPCDLKYLRRRIASVAEKLSHQEELLERAYSKITDTSEMAGLSPLDIYLSDLRFARSKT